MYEYYLRVTMADSKAISDELLEEIKRVIDESNKNASSARIKKTITYLGRISEYAIRVKLEAKRELVPSRALSSISRGLLQLEEPMLSEVKSHVERHCVISVTADENRRLTDREVMQELLEIYFGRSEMSTTNKELALETADEVRRAVEKYLSRKQTERV